LVRGDLLGTHPGGRFGHVPAQLGSLNRREKVTLDHPIIRRPAQYPHRPQLFSTRTPKLSSVDPLAWLTDVLQRIISGRTKNQELHTLLPWNCAHHPPSPPRNHHYDTLPCRLVTASMRHSRAVAAPVTRIPHMTPTVHNGCPCAGLVGHPQRL
jgi:hypothetical protein